MKSLLGLCLIFSSIAIFFARANEHPSGNSTSFY